MLFFRAYRFILGSDGTENAFATNFGSGTNATIIVDRPANSPGAAITHTLGAASYGGGTINISTGANVTSGTGTLVLGAVTLSSGSPQLTTFNPMTANVSLASVGGVTGGNNHTLGLGGLTAGNVIVGAISAQAGGGIVSVVKTSSSTWSLQGSSNYTGGTNISGGLLLANNGTASLGNGLTTIYSAGTLAGGTTATPGATGGNVTFNASGGTISAGNGVSATSAIGTLVIGTTAAPAQLTLSGTDSYIAKVYEDAAIAGSTGTVTFTSGNVATGSAVLNASDQLLVSGIGTTVTGDTLAVSPVVVSANASSGNTAYNVVIARSTTLGAFDTLIGTTVTLPNAVRTAGGTYQLASGNDAAGYNDLVLEFSPSAAPEPTSLLLAGLAMAPLTLGRRRGRKALAN